MSQENKHWGEDYVFAFSEILEAITEIRKKLLLNISTGKIKNIIDNKTKGIR